jgi:hypothetical protein
MVRAMNFPAFLTMLFENGCVQVPPAAPISPTEFDDAHEVLADYERDYRTSLAGVPPDFDVKIGSEAALCLYRICQCLVYRELEPQEVLRETQSEGGVAASATAHYSADLALRFLPDAWRLTRDASLNDPLVLILLRTASRWPLSSVGIPDTLTRSVDGFADNPSLLALYVDRIIERRDKSRLGDWRVREAILRAIGAHDEFAPELATTLGDSKKTLHGP